VPLWHERDISHSSVERVIAPDATIALDFMLSRMTYVLGNLCVYPDNMRRNLEKSGGTVFSEKVLLALVGKGIARDTAYRMVQRQALKIGREGGDLKRELIDDAEIRRYLSPKEIAAIWGVKHHLTHIDYIFRRAFQEFHLAES
jgi:adenylosuccinate lyase